ncbi:hypothetical protein ABTZ58_06945 [Streptomyces sp. NPDC094143]|uniref:hypothetical protein n=1 Tax=Streptomyces sp. NPDC094143 TaxID=3155310 RepID=UPI00331942AE
MTSPHATGPRHVVENALWDWWTTTDPAAPFDPADVAIRIDEHLHNAGLTIAPDPGIPTMHTPAPPSRAGIAFTAFLTLACATAGHAAFTRGEWPWAIAGALGAIMFTWAVADELAQRRTYRRRTTR